MTSPADSNVDADVNADVEAEGTSEAATPQSEPAPRPKLPAIVLTAAVALLVAAVAVAGWFGVAWFQTANDDGLAFSSTRDEVGRVAENAIETMNTLDYNKLDDGLADWANVTTGTLNGEVTRLSEDDKKSLRDAKWVASAKVRSLGVRELDERGGKAVVIAAVEVTVSIGGAKAKTDFRRVEGTLLRTGTGWKLDLLTPIQGAQPVAPPSN
jgi:Mce-associated membrane protein